MIDLNDTLFAISTDDEGTQLTVRILERDLGGDYPILAIVGEDLQDPEDQTVVRFSLEGASRKGKYALCNPEPETDEDEPVSAGGKVELPSFLQISVDHSRYGRGRVLKVRTHDTKSVYIQFDNGAKRWCFDSKITPAAYAF